MNRNKRKGTRVERQILNILKCHGFTALRSPSSLSHTDILVYELGTIQVKYRKRLISLYRELHSQIPSNCRNVIVECRYNDILITGTYLETFLRPQSDLIRVQLQHCHQLHQLMEDQDYLIAGSQYKPFMIFTERKREELLRRLKCKTCNGNAVKETL